MKTYMLFLIAALLVCQGSSAQENTPKTSLSGRVQSSEGNILEFSTISLKKVSDSVSVKTVITNAAGNFEIADIPDGIYFIQASLVGYKSHFTDSFTIDGALSNMIPNNPLSITLTATEKTMTEVVVSSKKPIIRRKLDKTILNVENSILSSGSTAFEILQMAPGVTIGNSDNIELLGKGSPLIMVDGKPSSLSKEQISIWLKGMSSDMISEIEIISQPSAKYDAAGVSGIINIVTKRIKTVGFTGNTVIATGYGRGGKYRGNVNMAYKANKYALTADYSYGFNNSIRYLTVDRVVFHPQGNVYFDRSGDMNNFSRIQNYKTSFTYFINKNNSVGLQLLGYENSEKLSSENFTGIFDYTRFLDSSLTSKSTENSTYKNLGGNFNFSSKLDTLGRMFTFDADYNVFRNKTFRIFSNKLSDKSGSIIGNEDFIRNNFPTLIKVATLKSDLVYPLRNKINLEMGVKASFVNTDNNNLLDSLINNQWKPSLSQSNQFIYNENIGSAYLLANKSFKKFSAQTGLRVEKTNSVSESLTLNSKATRKYVDFFPSLYLAREFNNNLNIGFSYSRRIERPNYQNLNPFRFYDDRYTYHEGNPYLKAAYTNSLELSSSFGKYYSTVLQYSKTTGVIAEDIQQEVLNDSTVFTKSFYRNYQTLNSLSVVLSFSKDVNSWWSTDKTITINRSQYLDTFGGLNRNLSNSNFALNFFEFFSLSKTISAELGGFYRTPSLYGFIKSNARFKIDVGLKKSLWNKKANIRLKITDIFDTNRFEGQAVYGDVDVKIINRFESRTAFLTFSLNFGNKKLEVKRRNGSDKDVRERVKKENE